MDAFAGDDAGNPLAALLRAVVTQGGPGKGGSGGQSGGCPPPRPVVLLGGAGAGAGAPAGAGRGDSSADAAAVMDQLGEHLAKSAGKPRLCVRISAEVMRREYGVRPLTLAIGAELARGGRESRGREGGGRGTWSHARATEPRLPDFRLMRDIVELALTEEPFAADPRRLRDHCYARRASRGPAACARRAPGGTSRRGEPGRRAASGWPALVVRRTLGPLVHDLPRWWWARRRTRRFMRPGSWYAQWPGSAGAGPEDGFFDSVGRLVRSRQIGARRSARTRGILRGVAAEAYEELLLRALLADLGAASAPRWYAPWRRGAGTGRFALLLELPGADGDPRHSPGALFLRKYRAAALATGCAAVVVIGAGPVGSAGECPDAVSELTDATRQLDAAAGVAPAEGGLPVLYAWLPGRRRAEGAALSPARWMAAGR